MPTIKRVDYKMLMKDINDFLAEDPETWWERTWVVDKFVTEQNVLNVAVDQTIKIMADLGQIESDYTKTGILKYIRYVPESQRQNMSDAAVKEHYEMVVSGLKDKIQSREKMVEQMAAQVKELQEKAAQTNEVIIEVQLKSGPKKVKTTKGLFHPKFKKVLSLVQARKNIMLYGPAGTGKTFLAGQVAESLKMRFGFIGCTAGMSENKITGSILPTGKGGVFEYQLSEFIDIFENGGIFLLDEMDAADPNVLLIINAALANGRIAIPARREKPYADRHPDFVCIAAMNTVGTGADRQYSGRNKLDMSTLDRFGVAKVFIDYDENLERALCPNEHLLTYCWGVRKCINANRLERCMSTRFIKEAGEMLAGDFGYEWSMQELFGTVQEGFFAGWREDEFNQVKQTLKSLRIELDPPPTGSAESEDDRLL